MGGLKWYPKTDLLSLNIRELNFGKKCWGKKVPFLGGLIPERFRCQDCGERPQKFLICLVKLSLLPHSKQNLDWDDCAR